MKMKFAICNEMFEGWKFEDICAAAGDAGYGGVELAPYTLGKLAGDVSAAERSELREAAARQGIEIIGLHWILAQTEGFHINSPDAQVRARTVDYLVDLTRLCSDLGGAVMIFGSPKQRSIHPDLTREQAWDFALDTFRQVVPTLEKHNVTLCFEPLGPQETDFLNTGDEAAEMIAQIDSPNFKLLLDVKAMSTESKPIPEIIRAHADILRHFHANDANRRGPGFGDTDFGPIADALKETGYQGWVSVEVFDFSPDPVTIATRSMHCLQEAFK